MLNRLKNLFAREAAPPRDDAPSDAVTVAALLVEAARADEHYTDTEKALIDRALHQEFGVSADRCAAVRAEAETLQAGAADLYRFTKKAKSLSAPAKIRLIESLWRVVLSDATRHSWEDTLIRRVAGLLYVSDVESGKARQRVEKEMKG